MAMYDSEEEDRRRDRFARERGAGDRYFSDRNGAPPDPYERRRDGGGFKRSYGGPRRDDEAKRPRTDVNTDGAMEPMQNLRQFSQDNDIALDSEEIAEKYAKYKEEYNKKLYKWFFDAHKNEEWFKNKYHPSNRAALAMSQKERIQKRLDIYNGLKDKGLLTDLSLTPENARRIVRLMNAVILSLEGSSDELVDKALRLEVPESAVDDVLRSGVTLPSEEDLIVDSSVLESLRTGAILIRNIPTSTTAEELSEVCQRSPGFLRLHMFDAQSECKWSRRAIATFKCTVDLKDVCLSISSVKTKGGDLVATIHRESTDRVRVSHPLINHKESALKILSKAAKVLAFLDKRQGFFVANPESTQEEIIRDLAVGVDVVGDSANPLVQKIRAALPGRFDDQEVMQRTDVTPDSAERLFERDDAVLSLLDEVAFYLRVVYSFDLLNYKHYEGEDDLPSRCGIFHIRGSDPEVNDQGMVSFKRGVLRLFEEDMQRHLDMVCAVTCVSETKMSELGALNPEDAVEELIKVNTVQLSEEKWLCPLSGKKFKGPDFIRKHITSKHGDAVEAAKADSIFFNNYLFDADRPLDKVEDPSEYRALDPRERRRFAPRRDVDRSPRKDVMRDPPVRRPHIAYRDLDAAPDMEVANVF